MCLLQLCLVLQCRDFHVTQLGSVQTSYRLKMQDTTPSSCLPGGNCVPDRCSAFILRVCVRACVCENCWCAFVFSGSFLSAGLCSVAMVTGGKVTTGVKPQMEKYFVYINALRMAVSCSVVYCTLFKDIVKTLLI